MRRRFLIDASALVPFFLQPTGPDARAKAAIVKLLGLRAEKKVILYVPNFCMAECSKAFAEVAFDAWTDFEKASTRYSQNVENLLDYVSIRRRGLIQSFPLKRRHLEDIEAVFKAEYSMRSRRDWKLLSGLDALVIAMGRDLGRIYGRDNVVIVTKDAQMARVCNHYRSAFPKAVYVLEDPIPG